MASPTSHASRRSRRPSAALRGIAAAAALAAAAPHAAAQDNVVTITARSLPGIGGFGDVAAARSPIAAASIGAQQIADRGASSLADLIALEPAAADAYNAEGYWSAVAIRGFVLDQRYNHRRDGLPINAETWIPLANKERVEFLKGTSGAQAGTSAPGGLVNYVVKRPTAERREARVQWTERASLLGAIDWSQRFGDDKRFGLRVNAGAERLRPKVRDAEGESHWIAVAGDWRPAAGSLFEAEIESSRRSQPSVPGFSLLGDAVPDPKRIDARPNLNNQAWSLPVVFEANTASLRWQQRIAGEWRLVAHGAVQRLRTDDRIAFPFGCSNDPATYYADRYCPDGSFDLFDFRSEGERRHLAALDLHVDGTLRTGALEHALTAGLSISKERARFGRQAFNYAGPGAIDGSVQTPPAPDLTEENTDRDERSTELYLRDRVPIAPAWSLWAGLRASRIERESVRTDGSRPTDYAQSFLTPWLALSHQLTDATMLYASWGQGVESEVVPNRSTYSNRGEVLPALKSRQLEAGVKHEAGAVAWTATLFDIERPQGSDRCDGGTPPLCTRVLGVPARHRGIDAGASWRGAEWEIGGGLQLLRARQGATRPANVPERGAKLQATRQAFGIGWQAAVVHEGRRTIVPGASIELPSWTRLDLAARWAGDLLGRKATARVGVDNATDRRAWRESPYQFGHAYLFPLEARTWRAALSAEF